MSRIEEYIREQLTDRLREVMTCPGCGEVTLSDDPIGTGAWCGLCGYRRSTPLPS